MEGNTVMPVEDPDKEATTFIFTELQEVTGEMDEYVMDSNGDDVAMERDT